MLDRIDIHIEVKPVKYEELSDNKKAESSKEISIRVNRAREMQLERFKDLNIYSNSQIPDKLLNSFCKLSKPCKELLELSFKKHKFSGRTYNKIIKVARTIADLDDSVDIEERHLLEAIRYRVLDTNYWGKS